MTMTRRLFLLQEDISKCEDKYNKSKMVHSIMRHVAETTPAMLEDLYQQFGWPLYKKFGHAFEAFKNLVHDPEEIFKQFKVVQAAEGTPSEVRTLARSGVECPCMLRRGGACARACRRLFASP